MASNIKTVAGEFHPADVREVVERYRVFYEVRPYYVVWEQRPEGAPPLDQRIQAGFDVNLYAALEKPRLPLFGTEEALKAVKYFESVAQEIQSRVGQRCTVEIIPCTDSIVVDTHQHFQPEAMLQIHICHDRGLDQPKGPSEEEALRAIREILHELGVREA
jgi:hypothetical protein